MAKEIQHELTFLPDESVIKRAERVGYGKPVSTIRKVRLLTIIICIKPLNGLIRAELFSRLKSLLTN